MIDIDRFFVTGEVPISPAIPAALRRLSHAVFRAEMIFRDIWRGDHARVSFAQFGGTGVSCRRTEFVAGERDT